MSSPLHGLPILSESPRAPFRLVRRLPIAVFVGLLCLSTAGAGGASSAGDDGGPTRSVAREASPSGFVGPIAGLAAAMGQAAPTRTLGFEDRVTYQRRIEEVYWAHRIWPKENPGAKPALDAVFPDAQIRAKVEDYLKKSNALEALWQRPITAGQLQAEMDRMAAQSRAPDVLREIFAALDDDPYVIAETLARQTLADRLIHNWYARDERFHGDLRRRAEAALAGVSSAAQLSSLGAEYTETTWTREREGGASEVEASESIADRERKPSQIPLDAEAWQEQLDRLAGLVGGEVERARAIETGKGRGVTAAAGSARASLDSLLLMKVSALQEDDGAFFVTSVIAKGADAVTVATATWPKTAFDSWWGEKSAAMSGDLEPAVSTFTLAEIAASGNCVPDSWMPSSAGLPAPSAREYHTVVWTGSEMIVWGGYPLTNSGGRYDPSTDSWVATSTGANVPSARQDHTAVWTGSEMIVWGGYPRTNTGGRYNPSTDSWLATSTGANVPSGRWWHTAVWTGNVMIVWGGVFGTNTGGRYNPSTDSWLATSTGDNVPSARQYHTAVWTGGEMIVWGGTDGTDVEHGRPLQPVQRQLAGDLDRRQRALRASIPHGGVDRQRDDRLGGGVRRHRVEHRRTLQPVHRQLAGDLDRRQRALRASIPHGGVDGQRDDRVGWDRHRVEHRRPLQPVHRQLGGDLDGRERALRALLAYGGVDGQRDDRLGWERRHRHGRPLQPFHRQLGGDLDRRERALRASRPHGGVDG